MNEFQDKVSLVRQIADLLRGNYKQHELGHLICSQVMALAREISTDVERPNTRTWPARITFEEPLLPTSHLDERLPAVESVQTLSRLNRRYPYKKMTADEEVQQSARVNDQDHIGEAKGDKLRSAIFERYDENQDTVSRIAQDEEFGETVVDLLLERTYEEARESSANKSNA